MGVMYHFCERGGPFFLVGLSFISEAIWTRDTPPIFNNLFSSYCHGDGLNIFIFHCLETTLMFESLI